MSDLDPWFNKVPQSSLEKLLDPIAEPIGKGLGGVVSFIMVPFMKLGVISEDKMTNFERKVATKNSRTPIENRDSSKQGLALKAVQDSVYQLDSEELQDMFSTLIASSLDNRINQNVLPSFSSILKDFSESDAVLFKKLYELNAVAKVDVVFTSSDKVNTLPVYDDVILLEDKVFLYEPISVNTLERLGLIVKETNGLVQPNYVKNYSDFKQSKTLESTHEKLKNFDGGSINFNAVKVVEGYIAVTPLGKQLGKTVIN